MRIRPAEPRDASEFAELSRRFNGSAGRLEKCDRDSERVIVAEVGGKLVGFACVQIVRSVCLDSPWAELTELFVDQASRHHGVGAALVAEVESTSWKSGCSALVLRTRTSNLEADTSRRLLSSAGGALGEG